MGIVEGSDTLSFDEHNIIGSTVGLEKLNIQAKSVWGWLTDSFFDYDRGFFFVNNVARCFFVCNISTINHKPVRCGSEVPGKLFIRTKRHSFEIVLIYFSKNAAVRLV